MTSTKGRHASRGPGTFYRDLAIMILGILVVGAAVFFLLYLFADRPVTGAETTTTTSADTTTTVGDETTTTVESPETTAPDTTTTSPVAVRPPVEVVVVVLNSTPLDGAAGRLTAEFSNAGYQTLPADNFSPEQDPSRIWYRDDFAAEAAAMVDLVDGATAEPLPDETLGEGADIVVVIGTGYTE